MTIVQLEYIVALDTYRHFVTAADNCFVTQPTLSMQVQKLEDELGIKIFDRSRHPLEPTITGKEIITQARKILAEVEHMKIMVKQEKDETIGSLKLAVIPTIAPYLIPLFLGEFLEKYPKLELMIEEIQTEEILRKLHEHTIDIGILAGPVDEKNITEIPLFKEAFVGYISEKHPLIQKEELHANDLSQNNLWLLNQGHCLRNQVVNICKEDSQSYKNFSYESGSLETLKKMVEQQMGYTLLPELAVQDLTPNQQKLIRRFASPQPVREISFVVHQHFFRHKLLEGIKQIILPKLPQEITNRQVENNVIKWR